MKAEAWSAQRTVYADANGFTIPKCDAVNCTYDWKKKWQKSWTSYWSCYWIKIWSYLISSFTVSLLRVFYYVINVCNNVLAILIVTLICSTRPTGAFDQKCSIKTLPFFFFKIHRKTPVDYRRLGTVLKKSLFLRVLSSAFWKIFRISVLWITCEPLLRAYIKSVQS